MGYDRLLGVGLNRNERIAALERQKGQIDTRRKILAGAWVLHRAQQDPAAQQRLIQSLDGFLVHPRDRELFDLPTNRDVLLPAFLHHVGGGHTHELTERCGSIVRRFHVLKKRPRLTSTMSSMLGSSTLPACGSSLNIAVSATPKLAISWVAVRHAGLARDGVLVEDGCCIIVERH